MFSQSNVRIAIFVSPTSTPHSTETGTASLGTHDFRFQGKTTESGPTHLEGPRRFSVTPWSFFVSFLLVPGPTQLLSVSATRTSPGSNTSLLTCHRVWLSQSRAESSGFHSTGDGVEGPIHTSPHWEAEPRAIGSFLHRVCKCIPSVRPSLHSPVHCISTAI